jgi:hypothetical protein
MNFNITIDEESYTLEVSDAIMQELQGTIKEMDADFDKGAQIGRYWIETPSDEQRCQLAADKVVSAVHQQNVRLFYQMAAYVLTKFPTLKMATVSSDFEVSDIHFEI